MSPSSAPVRWPLVVAGLAGASTMAVEIAAVRLLSPWYGSSLVVWTNVLLVILLGLSLGYLVGARLSAGRAPGRALIVVLLAAALVAAVTPELAAPTCELFLPRELALHDAAPHLTWGSLAAGLVLFLPSAALLGMIGPLLVEEIGRSGETHAGSAGGRVLAASTLGSVLGAFATTYSLLPHPGVGVSRTFHLVAALLAACAVGSAIANRSTRIPALLGALILLPTVWLSRLERPVLPEGLTLLDQSESLYQSVRIVEDARFGSTYRYLQVNEGFDSFQSAWRPEPGLLGEGFYYDDFALPPAWSRADEHWRVLVLGLGAGSALRVLRGTLPAEVQLRLTGVEIDREVVALAEAWLDLPDSDPAVVVHSGLDARFALHHLEGQFDQVILDAYANQVEIPPHLATVEFFSLVHRRLAEGGWAVANVGGFGFDDPVVSALSETLAFAFGRPVLVLRVPSARNFSLFARRGEDPPRPDRSGWELVEAADAQLGHLLEPRELPGGWHWVEPPDRPPLTDDRNSIERLQLQSLREGARRLRGDA